jgi:tetratricopeptide (TPR) repeat protein
MSEQEKVKTLLKEAVVYRNQGLYAQAREKFCSALEIMNQNDVLRNNTTLISAVEQKVREVDAILGDIDQDVGAPELSEDIQELIKKSFAFSKDKEAAAIEGAMALAKFGQFEKALEEFNEILEYATLPVMIAKNIIRCHLTASSPEAAVEQFTAWSEGDRFTREEIHHLREFLRGILESRDLDLAIPGGDEVQENPPGDAEPEEDEEEMDISSVNLRLEGAPESERREGFPVELQSGSTISIIVPASDKELIRLFKHGLRLPEIQCFSPIGFFPGSGTVTGKTKVLEGPNQGSFMVDIRLDD